MSDWEFTYEDFDEIEVCKENRGTLHSGDAKRMANAANARLAEERAKCEKAWGHMDDDFGVMVWFNDEEAAHKNTHECRLDGIRELKE